MQRAVVSQEGSSEQSSLALTPAAAQEAPPGHSFQSREQGQLHQRIPLPLEGTFIGGAACALPDPRAAHPLATAPDGL